MRLNFEGPNGAGEIEIDHEITVGRAPGNDLVLDDGQVSRRHVAFRPASDGILVEDLGSYNGTYVNGERIASVVLAAPGDTIKVGETELTVVSTTAAVDAPPLPVAPAPPPPAPADEAALAAVAPSPPPPVDVPPPPTAVVEPPPPAAFESPPLPEPPVYAAELPVPTAYEPPPPPAPSAEPATMVGGGWTPPAAAQVPRLIVRTGRDDGKEIALAQGREVTIGRDVASDFALSDARVSTHHARVRLDGEHLLVEDLGSANGTIVDGKRITGSEYAGEGSEIQVGETVILFTRQPSSFYSSSPSPTLVGGAVPQFDHQAVSQAVEQAVEARERRDRPKSLMFTAIGGAVAIAIGAGLAAFFLSGSDSALSESEIVERVTPATLRIDAYDPDGNIFSGGSGSIIDLDKGLVLTNNHVASVGALKVFSEMIGGDVDAELVAAAPCDDLALVRVPGLKDAVEGLKQVTFGDISSLKQGDRVIALGYPGAAEGFLGRSLSATTGVVSKVKTVYDQPGSGLPFLVNVIQTDAAINPGNSGGPLFNGKGHQVGVNTARFTGPSQAQNENYAVSMDRVNQVLGDLKEGRAPKWIGVTFSELINTQTGDFAALGIDNITPGGPADEVGLVGADASGEARFLILGVDGTEVTTFHEYCDAMPDDGTVTLQIGNRSTGKVSDVEISVGGFGR